MKRFLLTAFLLLLILCMMAGCGKEKPIEVSEDYEFPQTAHEAGNPLSHEERIAEKAKKYIPEKLDFNAGEYPLFDTPPALEEILEENFPAHFVFHKDEWTLHLEDTNVTYYTNDKNQKLAVLSDGTYTLQEEGVSFHSTIAWYSADGKLTGFNSENYDYAETIQYGWDESGEHETETPLTEIRIYGNPRYYYEIGGDGELRSTWVTQTEKANGGEIERRFIYDHTTESLQSCDLRYRRNGILAEEFIGEYRSDGTLHEVMYVEGGGDDTSDDLYRFDENFQFLEKFPAVQE